MQLWDVPAEPGRELLVADEVSFDPESKLTFEVGDPASAMQLFGIGSIEFDDGVVHVLSGPCGEAGSIGGDMIRAFRTRFDKNSGTT